MQLTNKQINETINTFDLLSDFVNPSRLSSGENEIRYADFMDRVVDELDLSHDEIFVMDSTGGRTRKYALLTIEQCFLVGMRESKSVRKSVMEKLKALEAKKFYIPQTYGEALQLCADQAKRLELAAPKVAFVDKLVDRTSLMTATQVAQKHGKSAVWLNKFLEEVSVFNRSVKRGRAFQQWFIDKGLGEMKQTELGYSQALFTNAGEIWIHEKLITEGAI